MGAAGQLQRREHVLQHRPVQAGRRRRTRRGTGRSTTSRTPRRRSPDTRASMRSAGSSGCGAAGRRSCTPTTPTCSRRASTTAATGCGTRAYAGDPAAAGRKGGWKWGAPTANSAGHRRGTRLHDPAQQEGPLAQARRRRRRHLAGPVRLGPDRHGDRRRLLGRWPHQRRHEEGQLRRPALPEVAEPTPPVRGRRLRDLQELPEEGSGLGDV